MGQRDPDHEKVGIYFLLFSFLSGFYLNVSHLYVTLLSVTKVTQKCHLNQVQLSCYLA